MPGLDRSRWILALMLQGGPGRAYNQPIVGRTRLVKELFLLKMTYGLKEMEYEFIPYWYGPFCAEAYADLQDLKETGFLTSVPGSGGDVFSLTPPGVKKAQETVAQLSPKVVQKVRDCKEKFNAMPFEELVAYVYERWPAFTTKALRSPAATLEEFRKQARKAKITEADVDRAIAEYRAQVS